jgi:hypothetical protein
VVVVPGVQWRGVVSSAMAPVLLVGSWTVAAGLQPGSFTVAFEQKLRPGMQRVTSS